MIEEMVENYRKKGVPIPYMSELEKTRLKREKERRETLLCALVVFVIMGIMIAYMLGADNRGLLNAPRFDDGFYKGF